MHRQSIILHFSGPVLLLRNLTHIQPLSVRAASAAEWRQFFVTSVESVYIRENLSRFEVVTFKCFYSDCHRGEQKMAGHWTQPQLRPMLYPQRSRDDSERQSRIRPMPTVSITGMFVLCDPRRGKCRGDNCTFAHSIEERDAWNARLFYMIHWQRETRRLYMYSYMFGRVHRYGRHWQLVSSDNKTHECSCSIGC